MATGAEMLVSIVNGLLSSREKGEDCLKEFIEKRLASREKGFFKPIKRSVIQIIIEKKKKTREISILKENQQVLGLFIAKYPDKKEAFSHPLTTYSLAFSTAQGTLYKSRRKHLFRNYLTDSSAAFVEIPSELNPVVMYDAMAVIHSVSSQPTWEDLFKILTKVYKLKESTGIILVFNNYTDELEYSLIEQERSDRAGSTAPLRTHTGEISQEIPQGKNYQEFQSNTKNKSQLLKKFTEYLTHDLMKRFNGSHNLEY